MIPNKTSILVNRVVIYTDITLEDLVFNTPNCICSYKNNWRATIHRKEFSMNVFSAKDLQKPGVVCMMFTKNENIEYFFPEFEKLFGARPELNNITFINRVEKFYTPYKNIYFEGLYDDLDKSDDINHFFIVDHAKKGKEKTRPGKIPSYIQQENGNNRNKKPRIQIEDTEMKNINPHLSMDLQRFCAMIVQPFPEEANAKIEIFDSGVLNVAGIPSNEYFYRIKKFIEEKLAPLLAKNSD